MGTAREWRDRFYELHVRGFVVAMVVLAMVWWAITKDRPMWLIPAIVLAAMALASPWWLRYQRTVETSIHINRALSVELDRARRYEHPMALVRVGSWVGAADGLFGSHGVASLVRSNDAWIFIGDDLYVVLPETDRDGARALTARLVSELGPHASRDDGVAVFPTDGVTTGALLECCRSTDQTRDVISIDLDSTVADEIAIIDLARTGTDDRRGHDQALDRQL